MPEISEEQLRKLETLRTKALSGKTMSKKESQVLSLAEEEGLVEDRGIGERVLSSLKGERGRDAAVLGTKTLMETSAGITGFRGGMQLGAKAPLPLPLKGPLMLGLGAAGAFGGAAGGNILAQLGLEGKEEIDVDESLLAAALEVIAPVVGKAVVKGFQATGKILSPIKSSTKFLESDFFKKFAGATKEPTPFKSKEAAGLATELQRLKVSVPLSTVFEGNLLSLADGLASKAILGRTTMKAQFRGAEEALEARIEDFAHKFATEASPLQVAKQLKKALNNDTTTFSSLRNKIVTRVDIASLDRPGAKVDLSFINKQEATFKEALDILTSIGFKRLDSPKIKAAMLKSARKLDTVSFNVDKDAARAAFPENRFLDKEFAEIEARQVLQSSGSFTDDVKTALDLTDDMGDKFNQTIIKRLVNTRPEEMLDVLFSKGRPDTLTTLFKMKDIDGKPLITKELKTGLQAAFLGLKGGDGLITSAEVTVDAVTRIDGKILSANIKKFEGRLGRGVGQALFEGTGLAGVKRYAKFLEILQSAKAEGFAGVALFLQSPAAITTLAAAPGVISGGDVGATAFGVVGASTILFGPLAFAKMLANPKTFDAFAKGFMKRVDKPGDLTFFLSTIAAQMAKDGDNVRVLDTDESDALLETTAEGVRKQERQQLRETQQGLLERIGDAPI